MIRKIILRTLAVFVLTVISQVGGIIYLCCLASYPFIDKKISGWLWRGLVKFSFFITIYVISIFTVIPLLAKQFGRVRLPILENNHVKPLLAMTWILNRNYVTPELRSAVIESAIEQDNIFPGSTIVYFDANFPFWNGFPLFPHLSHNDGKKLDIAFQYRDVFSGLYTADHPSIIGYGVCEEPLEGEVDMPLICDKKGFWQYSLLRRIIPQGDKKKFEFDNERTSQLIMELCKNKSVSKVFIEPHLKETWA